MKRRTIYVSAFLVILITVIIIFAGSKKSEVLITAPVQKGLFEVLVYTSGQLEAENSEKIVLPEELQGRNVRIYEIKITDLIEEGTQVQQGDYVASLDHKAVEEVLNIAREELEQAINDFEDAKMDSNLNLSNLRDQIISAQENVEELQIVLEESLYESPSVIRKAEMDLDKAKRNLEQEKLGYELKTKQAATRVERRVLNMRQRETRLQELEQAYRSLNIHAPKPGMVIYAKDRFGDKIKVGSTVSRWMPVIATLPDLSNMISITYVNEIDISRLKTGQQVTLGIDAFPEKQLQGEVMEVANIGQPMPKSDAKVFEVKIKIKGYDTDLKPAMTTSNTIRTGTFREVLYIPTDAIFQNDSLRYVFLKKDKIVKQVIDAGDENENYIIVNKGLNEGDEVLLSKPANEEAIPLAGLEIYEEIKKREEENKNKQPGNGGPTSAQTMAEPQPQAGRTNN